MVNVQVGFWERGKQRAAGDNLNIQLLTAFDDLIGGGFLDNHPGQKDHIRPLEMLVLQTGGVQVNQFFVPGVRQHRRDSQQSQRRQQRLFGHKTQGMFQAPERSRHFGVDQQDFLFSRHPYTHKNSKVIFSCFTLVPNIFPLQYFP